MQKYTNETHEHGHHLDLTAGHMLFLYVWSLLNEQSRPWQDVQHVRSSTLKKIWPVKTSASSFWCQVVLNIGWQKNIGNTLDSFVEPFEQCSESLCHYTGWLTGIHAQPVIGSWLRILVVWALFVVVSNVWKPRVYLINISMFGNSYRWNIPTYGMKLMEYARLPSGND